MVDIRGVQNPYRCGLLETLVASSFLHRTLQSIYRQGEFNSGLRTNAVSAGTDSQYAIVKIEGYGVKIIVR